MASMIRELLARWFGRAEAPASPPNDSAASTDSADRPAVRFTASGQDIDLVALLRAALLEQGHAAQPCEDGVVLPSGFTLYPQLKSYEVDAESRWHTSTGIVIAHPVLIGPYRLSEYQHTANKDLDLPQFRGQLLI